MKPEALLFALLRSVVCGQPLDEKMNEYCTEDVLVEVCTLTQKHDLSHLVAQALEKLNLPRSEPLARLQTAKTQAIARYIRLDYEFERICAVLEKGRIPYIPLKGAVIRSQYPEPWMRTSCDIDILIHEEDLDRTVDLIMEQLSYSTDRKKAYHDVSMFSKNGVHLELHFSIKENMDNIDSLLSRAWDFADPRTEYGFALQKEFMIFYLIAHMSYHFIGGGCGVRPFLDLFLLRKCWVYDDNVVHDYLSACGLVKFYDSTISLMDVWFGGKEHSTLTRQMEMYLFAGGIYGCADQQIAVQQGKKGERLGYLLSRIFVPHRDLKIRYRILEKYPVLHPIMQIRRWGEMLFSKKFQRSVEEIKFNNQITKKQTENMNLFLSQLGL